MGEQGVCGDKETGAQCEPARLAPQFLVARELFPDDSLKQGNTSLLQRVDRLDKFLSIMEDKTLTEPSGNSGRYITSTPSSLEKRCKSTESVLEEVEEKGTLVERVSELEERLIKLQRMMSNNIASPGSTVEGTTCANHSSAPDNEALIPNQLGAHAHDHEQFSQDPIDVQKHEVTILSSDPVEYDQQHKPFVDSENIDTSQQKLESPVHKVDLGHQGMGSSEGTSVEDEDTRAHQHQYKKKSQKLKRWIAKRLHIGSTTRQGKVHTSSTAHCWSSHIMTSPKSCWNLNRGELHAHYGHKRIDEDSP